MQGCEFAIIYSPPSNTVDLLQQIGRVGRTGLPSIAFLMHSRYNIRYCDSDVKEIYKPSVCRRHALMQYYLKPRQLQDLKAEMGLHTCCDVCAMNCTCGNCELLSLEPERICNQIEEVGDSDDSLH